MKLITSIITVFSLIICTHALYAKDVGLGIAVWYADWEMENPNGGKRKMDSVFYIGPSISYQFSPAWNITLLGLYTPLPYEMPDDLETTEITRYDGDLTLNYQISRYVKVFFGGKYLGFVFDGGRHHGAGPGGGIGLTIPIIGNFYFLGNASALYLKGTHKDNQSNMNFDEYGYNTAAQVAYYIASLGLTTSIGYRYQHLTSKYDTNDIERDEDQHTFKGFTFLIIKSFHSE